MYIFYKYVRDEDSLKALETPDAEMYELKGLEYDDKIEALQICTKNKDYFYAPMTKEQAHRFMHDMCAVGSNGNAEIEGIIIFETEADGLLYNGNRAAKALLEQCREQTYSVRRV